MHPLTILLQGQQSAMPTIIMFALMFVVFYFFMIRPQQKKAKAARQFRESLQKGTRVVTIGGLHGKIVEVEEKTVLLEVDNNVKLRFERSAIAMDSTQQLTEEAARAAR